MNLSEVESGECPLSGGLGVRPHPAQGETDGVMDLSGSAEWSAFTFSKLEGVSRDRAEENFDSNQTASRGEGHENHRAACV